MRARQLPLALAAAVLALAACSTPRPDQRPGRVTLDTTWYISSRLRDEDRHGPHLADSLEFGAVVTRRSTTDPLAPRISMRRVDSLLLSRAEFVTRLKARLASSPSGPAGSPRTSPLTFFYTHGYGTSLEESWQHTVTASVRSRSSAPWVVFAWPSIGSGVAWTGRADIVAAAYGRDSVMAHASSGAYARALEAVREAAGSAGVVVVAHSMGAHVVSDALGADAALRTVLLTDPLRAVAFFSPDVSADFFGDTLVPELLPVTRRLVLYATSDDRALAAAKMYTDEPRAGRFDRADGSPLVRPGLESVDMTDGAGTAGFLHRAFGPRHALRRRTGALFDLVHLVGPGRDPGCRELIGSGRQLATGAWSLTPQDPPSLSVLARCAVPSAETTPAADSGGTPRTDTLSVR